MNVKISAAVLFAWIPPQFDLVDPIGIKPDDLFHAISKVMFSTAYKTQAAP
jgi:hypothetical protein